MGASISPIKGRGACGITNPVRVSAVAGVQLSTPATLTCPAARALEEWVITGAKPAVGRKGGGLASLDVAASYACRTRNNRRGARLSDWGTRKHGSSLRKMWRSACGPFGVVLGPEADRFHRDHFHFDVSNKRRPFCR